MKNQKKNVLVAEDDDFLGNMIRKSLDSHGMKVSVARTGKEAIAAIDRQKPDLLLLDILMPEIDGYGVLQHMQKNNCAITTIIVSNLSSTEDKEKCKKLGCKAFIVKSDMDDDALWPTIKKYLK